MSLSETLDLCQLQGRSQTLTLTFDLTVNGAMGLYYIFNSLNYISEEKCIWRLIRHVWWRDTEETNLSCFQLMQRKCKHTNTYETNKYRIRLMAVFTSMLPPLDTASDSKPQRIGSRWPRQTGLFHFLTLGLRLVALLLVSCGDSTKSSSCSSGSLSLCLKPG